MDNDNTPQNNTKPTLEDQRIEEATKDLDLEQAQSSSSKATAPKPMKPKMSKKKLVIFGVALLLIVGGIVAWLLLKGSDAKPTASQDSGQTTTEEAITADTKTYTPNTVVYAYQQSTGSPYSLYWRPAAGGERKESLKLGSNKYIMTRDVRGANVAFASDDGVFMSIDSGATFKQVVTLQAGEQVTSVRFATSGKKLAYALLGESRKNTVKTIGLDGKAASDLFTAEEAGVFMYGWNDSTNQVFYSRGCYNCDGSPSTYILHDVKAKQGKEIKLKSDAQKSYYLYGVVISDDMTKIVSYTAAPDTDTSAGLSAGVAPYTVQTYDVKAGTLTTAATIGSKGEKNSNGTLKTYDVFTGFMARSNTAYYAAGSNVYKISGDKPTILYAADSPIFSVTYVSDKNVFAGSGKDQNDYTLYNYVVADKKATNIFNGDNQTVVIGVTEK